MSVFNRYARYYDLLYRDKDYPSEARFIQHLLQSYAPDAQSILELGCGTGKHAVLLAKEGYRVHGIDLSFEMLQQAHQQQAELPEELASCLTFSQANIQTLQLDQHFDVVLSLFHVVSYQITNQALEATFATVDAHLKPGGVLIFDCWYGPAVLSDRPTVRVKRMEDEDIGVTRIAEPVLLPNENLVNVNYQILITDKQSGAVEELRETHQMRYLFSPEISWLLDRFQLKLVGSCEWMSQREPGFDTWGVCFTARKQERHK